MTHTKKIYLAHPISTTGEFNDSIRVAEELRALGCEVYAAAENTGINDKSNEPTPKDIYREDVLEILTCDIFVVNLTGGHQDGTISEVGVVAGVNEVEDMLDEIYGLSSKIIPIVGYTSNARMLQPQFSDGIPSASANHLVLGAIQEWGKFVGGENVMLHAVELMLDGYKLEELGSF